MPFGSFRTFDHKDGTTRKPGGKKVIFARLCPPQLSEHETWANARLMVAAPELLEAAKAGRVFLAEMIEIAQKGQTIKIGNAVNTEKLDALIAKAEGRTPYLPHVEPAASDEATVSGEAKP